MQRQRLMRKWTEEKSISALYARLDEKPVVPNLVHDDGRFRIYQAGDVLFLAGEITDVRPTLYKSANGWQPLEPRLSDLAQEMTKLFPDKLPGKSSSTRTRLMRNMVGLTPKGFGLGDSALWLGLVTAKKDFDEAQPRDELGRWTDTGAGRPGTGPAPRPVSAQTHAARQAALKLRDWQANVTSRQDEFVGRYSAHPQFEAFRLSKTPEMDEGNWDENPEPISVTEAIQAIYSAWYTDVSAMPVSAAFQKLVADKFGLPPKPAPFTAQLDETLGQYGDLLKQMVDDTYADTQKQLADLGISEVEVVRGVRNLSPGVTTGFHTDVEISGNAISSWTTEMDRANRFVATPGMVLRATIPASKIFALGGHSLIGNQGEREVVVISDNLRGDLWAWDETSGTRPEGVWKMTGKSTLNIDVDATDENANWLHPKSLREQVLKAMDDKPFDESKHNRDDEGKFAPKGAADIDSEVARLPYKLPGFQQKDEGQGDYEFKGPKPKSLSDAELPKPAAGEPKPAAPVKPWVPTQAERFPPKVVAKPFGARLGEKSLANGTILSVDEGDLLAAPVDAIVNAANEDLQHGGGVAGAIRKVGGYGIQEASNRWVAKYGKATPKRAAATTGGSLPAKYIMHAVAPIYTDGTKGEAQDMEDAYYSAMRLAHKNGATSLAFPSLGTGIFGNPLSLGTASALKAAQRFATEFPETPLKNIHIVVRPEDKDTHEAFGNMINDRPVVDKPKYVPPPVTSKPGKTFEATAGGWYKPVKPGQPRAKPLITNEVSDEVIQVAESLGNDKDNPDSKRLANTVADLEAELFRGNRKGARVHYLTLPREIKEMLPPLVRDLLMAQGVFAPKPAEPKAEQKPLPLAPSEPEKPAPPKGKLEAWAKGIQDRLKGKPS